jgi:hypothetical protein
MNAARRFESTKMRVFYARIRMERLRRDVDAEAARVALFAGQCAGSMSRIAQLRAQIERDHVCASAGSPSAAQLVAISEPANDDYVRGLVSQAERSAHQRVYSNDEVLSRLAEARRGRTRRMGA